MHIDLFHLGLFFSLMCVCYFSLHQKQFYYPHASETQNLSLLFSCDVIDFKEI